MKLKLLSKGNKVIEEKDNLINHTKSDEILLPHGQTVDRRNEKPLTAENVANEKFFIEIGSSDFDTLLPLARNGWSGIIVEPNDFILNNLVRYENVIYENVAILEYDGTTEFLSYDPEFLDGVSNMTIANQFSTDNYGIARGISTTDIENPSSFEYRRIGGPREVKKCGDWEKYERITKVDCITLDTLIDKHKVNRIDYLKIDAEGKDHVILENYSWKIKPTFIKVESSGWEQIGEFYGIDDIESKIKELLNGMGYIVHSERDDLYAIQ